MNEVLCFVSGVIVGSMIGMVIMCVLQINKIK